MALAAEAEAFRVTLLSHDPPDDSAARQVAQALAGFGLRSGAIEERSGVGSRGEVAGKIIEVELHWPRCRRGAARAQLFAYRPTSAFVALISGRRAAFHAWPIGARVVAGRPSR